MKTILLSLVICCCSFAQITPTACTPVDGTPGAGTVMAGTGAGTLATIINTCTGNLATALGNAVNIASIYSNPTWLTGIAWSKVLGAPSFATVATTGAYSDLTGKPTIPTPNGTSGQALTSNGSGGFGTPVTLGGSATHGFTITINGVSCSLDGSCTVGSGVISSVFGRTGVVVATSGDYTASQVTNAVDSTGSYSNPAWLTALASSKITGLPAFPAGTIVGTTDTQALTNKTLDGVSPATMAFVDPTSSIQTQINGKQPSLGFTAENVANKDAASGYAGLTAGSLLKTAEMPALTGDCTTSAGTVAVTCGSAIARTGTDVNTSNQVTATHLAAGLPRAQGGLNSTSAGTGILRDGTTPTASELSGDATTSGSNAVTVSKLNGTSLAGLATGILKNTTGTGVPSVAAAGTDYQAPISLTTTGSGAASLVSNTLNVPNFSAKFPNAATRGQGTTFACHWVGNNDVGTPYTGRQAYISISGDSGKFEVVDAGPVYSTGAGIQTWMQDTACAIWYPSDVPTGVLILGGDGFAVGYNMQMTTTRDLKTFTAIQSLSPSFTGTWTPGTPATTNTNNASPSIFINPVDNSFHWLWQAAPCTSPCTNSAPITGNFNLWETHPTTQTYAGLTGGGTWSQGVQLNASGTYIDPFMLQVGSNFCLWAKENTGFTIQKNCQSTLAGPFSLAAIGTITTTHLEKPSLVPIDSSTLRMYTDYECGSQPYTYRDSTDGGVTWGSPSNVGQPTGAYTYGQGIVNGCAGGSYYMRAGTFARTVDPVWMGILQNAYDTPVSSRPLNTGPGSHTINGPLTVTGGITGGVQSAEVSLGRFIVGTTSSPYTDPSGTTFTNSSGTITITNFPQTYSGIGMKVFATPGSGAGITINGNTSNFRYAYIQEVQAGSGNVTTGGSPATGSFGFCPVPGSGNYGSTCDLEIFGYANTSLYKLMWGRVYSGTQILGYANPPQFQLTNGSWDSTSAVTTIVIGAFASGSTISLLGIY